MGAGPKVTVPGREVVLSPNVNQSSGLVRPGDQCYEHKLLADDEIQLTDGQSNLPYSTEQWSKMTFVAVPIWPC